MRKAGGIIGLIAGIFGVIGAIVTLAVGAGGGCVQGRGCRPPLWDWAGLVCSSRSFASCWEQWPWQPKGGSLGSCWSSPPLLPRSWEGLSWRFACCWHLSAGLLAAIPGRERAVRLPTAGSAGSMPPGGCPVSRRDFRTYRLLLLPVAGTLGLVPWSTRPGERRST